MEQSFEGMELDKSLVDALKKNNITVPTNIQQKGNTGGSEKQGRYNAVFHGHR